MKICLVAPGAYPVPATEGGAVETLMEIMAENYQSETLDFSLDIISADSASAREKAKEYSKVRFFFIPWHERAEDIASFVIRGIRKLTGKQIRELDPFFRKVLRLIRKNAYDVVIAENAMYFIGALKRHTDARVVLHLHNKYREAAWGKASATIGKADAVIAVSDFVADCLRKEEGMTCPIVTVKNVIDTKKFEGSEECCEKAEALRRDFGFLPEDTVGVFVGRLIEEKGVGTLLDAVTELEDEHIKLLIVGGSDFGDSEVTPFEKALRDKAAAHPGKVVFTGYVPYDDLVPYYHAGDVAVFPSKEGEAAGLVALEAQSAGKPVILSRSGGMPDYVCDDSAIILENDETLKESLKKELLRLSQDKERQNRMGEAGRRFAAAFDRRGYLKAIVDGMSRALNDGKE